MLRALVVALLLANAGFLAWRAGWLEPLHGVIGARPEGEREPRRLQRQVNPQAVQLLGGGAAGPAPLGAAAAPGLATASAPALAAGPDGACLEAGPFGSAELASVQAALQAALPEGVWTVRALPPGGAWWVALGPYADAEALQRRLEELRRRKVAAEPAGPGAPLLLVLGRHDSRTGAEQALAGLAARNLRGARVVEGRPQPQLALRVAAADAAQQARLAALPPERLQGHAFAACPSVPPAP
jgi:hypothetical protein